MTNTNSDDSREWAAQAYALLKKRQEQEKQDLQKQEQEKDRVKAARELTSSRSSSLCSVYSEIQQKKKLQEGKEIEK